MVSSADCLSLVLSGVALDEAEARATLARRQEEADIRTTLAAIDHLNGHGAYVLTSDEDAAIKRLAGLVYR